MRADEPKEDSGLQRSNTAADKHPGLLNRDLTGEATIRRSRAGREDEIPKAWVTGSRPPPHGSMCNCHPQNRDMTTGNRRQKKLDWLRKPDGLRSLC